MELFEVYFFVSIFYCWIFLVLCYGSFNLWITSVLTIQCRRVVPGNNYTSASVSCWNLYGSIIELDHQFLLENIRIFLQSSQCLL